MESATGTSPQLPPEDEGRRDRTPWIYATAALAVIALGLAIVALILAKDASNEESAKNAASQDDLAQVQSSVDELKSDIEQEKKSQGSETTETSDLSSKLQKLEDDVTQLEGDQKSTSSSITQLQSDIDDLTTEVDRIKAQQGSTTPP